MPFQGLQLYCAIFTIDGVEHTLTGYAESNKDCELHSQQNIDSINAAVPEQEAKLVSVHFGITQEEQKKIVAESSAKNPEMTTTNPLLLHKPQTEVIGT